MLKPIDYKTLFLDMDSFFASVEQQVQPTLRGQPIGVAPYCGNTGCIIAASREAKKIGIKTGTLVGEAKKICPNIKILESRPALYMLYHQEIVKVLGKITPFYKILSIDEMTLELEPRERYPDKAQTVAARLKDEIRQNIGDYLTCSIGVGPNQFLAKVAGEFKKPDGFYCVSLNELPNFYPGLKLLDLPGINFQMQIHLNQIGINTPLEFFQTPLSQLTQTFGHFGRVWYFRLRGWETDDFASPTKTIGHSYVLAPQFRNPEAAKKVLLKLAAKIGYRLRKRRLTATGLSLGVRFLGNGFKRAYLRCESFSDTHTLTRLSLNLFSKIHFVSQPLTLYLTAFGLNHGKNQPPLFPGELKKINLSRAIDKINDKYGASTIQNGTIIDTEEAAPDRIPFGQPRYEIRY